MFCPKCGSSTDDGAEFCRNCGIRLSDYVPQFMSQASAGIEANVTQQPDSQPLELDAWNTAPARKRNKLPLFIGIFAAVIVLVTVVVLLFVFRIEKVTDMDYSLPYGEKTITGKYTGTIQLGKPQGMGEFKFSDSGEDSNNQDYITNYCYSGEYKAGTFSGTGNVRAEYNYCDFFGTWYHCANFVYDGEFKDLKPYNCSFVMTVPPDYPSNMSADDYFVCKGTYKDGFFDIDISDNDFVSWSKDFAEKFPIVSGFSDSIIGLVEELVESTHNPNNYGLFQF